MDQLQTFEVNFLCEEITLVFHSRYIWIKGKVLLFLAPQASGCRCAQQRAPFLSPFLMTTPYSPGRQPKWSPSCLGCAQHKGRAGLLALRWKPRWPLPLLKASPRRAQAVTHPNQPPEGLLWRQLPECVFSRLPGDMSLCFVFAMWFPPPLPCSNGVGWPLSTLFAPRTQAAQQRQAGSSATPGAAQKWVRLLSSHSKQPNRFTVISWAPVMLPDREASKKGWGIEGGRLFPSLCECTLVEVTTGPGHMQSL